MKSAFQSIFAVIVGLLLIAGAAAGWKFWQIDGFIASMLGCAGVALIGTAFGKEFF